MNKNKLFSRTSICVVFCSALTFSPFGVRPLYADTQVVQRKQSVHGTVVDDMGEPIIGASVLIVGAKATQGTVTDLDGNFTLNVRPGTKIKITYLGMVDVETSAKEGMKIQMKSAGAVELGGVEVVAYGVQKKVTVTGALSSVKGEDLVRTPVSSVNNVLAGQLSGVTTVQYSGEPGSDAATVFVRGKATWGDSSPLIQVDGVERSMTDIDPNEIESITVLKDASATAVFGVRGANGVVLITTKRGKEGKAKISFSTNWSALTPTKMVEQATSYDYGVFYNRMRANDGQAPMFSEEVLQKFKDGSDPIRFPNTQWTNYIMKDVTLQTQHNMNISGGTDRVRYFISAGMYTQGGLFKEFEMPYDYGYQYQRFNYRANLDLKATKTTTLSFNVAGNVNNADKPYTGQGSSGMIKNIYYATPFSSPGIVDGKMVYTTTDYTDGLQLPFTGGTGMAYYGNGFMQTNNNKLQMDLVLEQKLDMLTKGLVFKAKGSYNSAYGIYKEGKSSVAAYYPMIQPDGSILFRKDGETTVPTYGSRQSKGRDWYFEGSFNYNRVFGSHTVSGLLLYNQSKQYYYSSAYSDTPRSYVGVVGRATYDYKNRYMAEFNIGYNGSENFAPGKRFGVFPAGSVGWVMSDENFFHPVKKLVSFLKLRASWGLVGNDKTTTGRRFMYLSDPYYIGSDALASNAYVSGDNYHGYAFGIWAPQINPTATKGAYEQSKNNPDVGWEKAFKQDYGVDINFFNDRLRTTFDYYFEHRTDILLIDGTVPSLIGFTVPYANLGEVNSHGWEISLNWNDKIGNDFRYWAKVNLSHNWNEVLEMKEAPKNNTYQYAKGHRIGARSQYQFWKFYEGEQTKAEYEQNFGMPWPEQMTSDLQPGDCVLVDLDGNGKIDENDMSRDYGYTDDPHYVGGLTLGFEWKRLAFNAQFTGAWNVSRMLSDVFRRPFFRSADNIYGGLLQYHVDNTWSPENHNADYPRASWASESNNYAESTLYEKDAKYLRLKTLSLGYDFNNRALKTIGITKCEVMLSGYNLLTFTPYKWGDPETRASNAPSYPLQRTYTIGLNLSF
ncbi:TonB-linked outer membrane protein, SusC/RagA family [Hallella bergensis DSM 17361]|uniref:TonB-linked outer membrane protein, SusC/RagA family n=1 Tax=Hallella bergensis DSM 17361 TaxID=585502 RepID=D1PZD9_9BACT|nr:TonB-dependent receptor [Hallella bergensis]EFA43373.1 TonB-linked outer membrane protein, SusC/RagA family [Hallella bergensis DSM 17361]